MRGHRRAGRHPLRAPGRAARPRPRGRRGRKHVGDEPFVVLLGDDIMDDDSHAARRHDRAHERTGASVIALKECPPEEISALRLRARPSASSDDELVRIARHRREAASRRGAVEPGGHGPLRVHARDLRRHRAGAAGRGRRDPAHRRHRAAARASRRSTAARSSEAATTSATSSTTCEPPSSSRSSGRTSGPAFRAFLADLAKRERRA